MRRLPRVLFQKKLLAGFVVLLVGLGFSQHVHAVSPSDYIGSNTIFYTVSAGSNSGSGSGATNLLYAPDTYLIAYYGGQDGNTIELPHGGFCSSQDSRARNAKLIVYGYSTVSEKKNGSQFYNYERIRSGTRKTLGEITAESCNSTYSFTVPSDWLAQSNVPNHVSQFGTPLYPMIVRVRIAYDGNKSDPVTTGAGPLNTFKVNAPGGYTGAWTLDPDKWRSESFTGGTSGQTVWLGRPSNMNTQDYTIPLTPPCTLFGDNNEHDVWLHWYDDDQGTSYQNPDITMFLTTIKPDGTRTERQLGAADGLRFGGEAGFGRVKIKVRKGYKYIWKWKDVTNKNGVRAWLPFNTSESYFDCDASHPLRGSCEINITNPSSKVVAPGQTITGTITVNNTGANPWSVLYPSASGTASFRLGVVGDNDRWGPGTKRLAIQPSVTGAFGPILESGKTTNTPVTFTAPATMSETETLTYRLLLEGDGVARTPYASCEAVFKTNVNRPYVSVSGGDVYSGAAFADMGSCTVSADAKDAAIITNGYHGSTNLNALNGSSTGQYGVFASGDIGSTEGGTNTFRGNFGYARGVQTGQDDIQDALFANYSVAEYGRFYLDLLDPLPLPCVDISRYFNADEGGGYTVLTSQSDVNAFLALPGYAVGVINGTDITLGSLSVASGQRKVLIVQNADIAITGDISYQDYTLQTIPSLTLIAHKGNIYVSRPVQQIDASLIAFPDITNTGVNTKGLIDTCADVAGPGVWPTTLSVGSCNSSKLTINGSVAARRIVWKRTIGTLGFKSDALDPACYFGNYSDSADTPFIDPGASDVVDRAVARSIRCAAEVVNFSPEAYLEELGNQPNSAPITTQELPPIY
ncbi:hypothetical protein KC973_00640 [Candidatus Saccharibacteria bacterium]|nr:hypothetical protein [Candidatus Saccharibacteria bacterium]